MPAGSPFLLQRPALAGWLVLLATLALGLGGCASRPTTPADPGALRAALYDGWACVSSANFDKLSLRIYQETDLANSGPRFVEPLRRDLFEADFARSKEWTEAQPVRWNDYIAEFVADQL